MSKCGSDEMDDRAGGQKYDDRSNRKLHVSYFLTSEPLDLLTLSAGQIKCLIASLRPELA